MMAGGCADGILRNFVAKNRGKMDQGIWNAFITAAGRASQLQRAVQALGEMQVRTSPLMPYHGLIISLFADKPWQLACTQQLHRPQQLELMVAELLCKGTACPLLLILRLALSDFGVDTGQRSQTRSDNIRRSDGRLCA